MSTASWQDWLDRGLGGHCALCESDLSGAALCIHCRHSLPALPQPCPVCALPMQAFCAHPAGWRLNSLHVPFVYSGSVSVLIGRLKFQRQRWLGRVIGRVLGSTLNGHFDWCMPVPLHRRRLAQRGFNQALEIARGVAPSIDGMRIVTGGLRRLRNTPPQAQLSVKARKKNLIGCFTVDASVERRRILLVDDVVTTGSTLNVLATLLQQRGAAHVGGVAFARAIGPHVIKV